MSTSAEAFGLGTFSEGDGEPFPGLVIDDAVLDLRPSLAPGTTTLDMLEDWDPSLGILREIRRESPAGVRPLDDLRPHPPVASRQIFCAGANYTKHVRQIMFTAAKSDPNERRSDEQLRAAAEESVRERSASGTP